MSEMSQVTVWITRTARPGCELDFERALHDFVQRSLSQPGQLGVHVTRPVPGSGSREYRIVRKFADREALAAFRASPDYLEWDRQVCQLTEGEGHFEELAGLESWFTPAGAVLHPLPRWKMALVTFVGVYPLTSILPRLFLRLLPGWHPLLVNIVVTGLIVGSLTWVIMPLLSRLLHPWLHPEQNVRTT